MDIIPWFATFAVSLLAGLEYGILVGFMISVLFILYYAARPGIKVKKAVVIMNTKSHNRQAGSVFPVNVTLHL